MKNLLLLIGLLALLSCEPEFEQDVNIQGTWTVVGHNGKDVSSLDWSYNFGESTFDEYVHDNNYYQESNPVSRRYMIFDNKIVLGDESYNMDLSKNQMILTGDDRLVLIKW